MAKAKCTCLDPKAKRSQFGSLRVLPSGRHQARFTAPNGAIITAPHTFDSHGDAMKWLSVQRGKIVEGSWKPPEPETITFGDYAERWLEQRELKPRTAHHYRTILDRFLLPTFKDTALGAITPDSVRAWHAKLITGKTYRAHAYALLRTILRTAVDDRLITASPCVIRGAGSSKRARDITTAELDDLEKLIAAMPTRLQMMVILGAWCALRYGELAELRRSDIDVKKGVIRVRRGVTWVDGEAIIGSPKSEAGVRDIAVPPHLLPALKAHLSEHAQFGKDGLLFPSAKGENLTSATFYESWWKARDEAGLPTLRFHDLRHTGAVLAARSGATLAELMGRLGHSTPAAAMRYQHAAASRDQVIAAALSALATGGSA